MNWVSATALAAGSAFACIVGVVSLANAQEGTAVSAARQNEIILDRQTFMEGVYEWLNEGDVPDDPVKYAAMKEEAQRISEILPALQYMFPPETNPDDPRFKATFKTYALPGIWKNYGQFSANLKSVVDTTAAMWRTTNKADFTKLAKQLDEKCDACHDQFRAPFNTPF